MSVTDGAPRQLGRYTLYGEIAAGGMATVHVGRLVGSAGFARVVAIKRLHPQLAKDPEFVAMFVDEARLAARIRHPSVVPTLDVVAEDDELFLVMEYVAGEPLSRLLGETRTRHERLPLPVVSAIVSGMLRGLHAAHEAKSEQGEPLGVVHRDISPQNVLVGTDGIARILDFGVAKAVGRLQSTREGQLKGKLSYMAPEQLSGTVDRRTDVYAAGIVLWEALVGQRAVRGETEAETLYKVMYETIRPPSELCPSVPQELDEVARRAVSKRPDDRYATALEMAVALEAAVPPAPAVQVGDLVELLGATSLAVRGRLIAELERNPGGAPSVPGIPLGPTRDDMSIAANTVEKTTTEMSATTGPRPHPRPSGFPGRGAAIGGAVLLVVAGLFFAVRTVPTPSSATPSAPAVAAPAAASSPAATLAPAATTVSAIEDLPPAPSASTATSSPTTTSRTPTPARPAPPGVARPAKRVVDDGSSDRK